MGNCGFAVESVMGDPSQTISPAIPPSHPAVKPPDRVGLRGLLVQAVAVSSVGAGIIHLLVVREHLHEYWLFGTVFAVLAGAQVIWSLLVFGKTSRRVLLPGIALNLGTVA